MLSQILDEIEDLRERLRKLQSAMDADTLEGGIRPSRWYSTADVAEREDCTQETVRDWVRKGYLGDEGEGWRQNTARSPIYVYGNAWIRHRRSRRKRA